MEHIPLYDGQAIRELAANLVRNARQVSRRYDKAVCGCFQLLPRFSAIFLLFQRVSHQACLDCLCLPSEP